MTQHNFLSPCHVPCIKIFSKTNETKWLCLTFFFFFSIVNITIFLSLQLDVRNVFYYGGYKFTCNLHSNKTSKTTSSTFTASTTFFFPTCRVLTTTSLNSLFLYSTYLMYGYCLKVQVEIYEHPTCSCFYRRERKKNQKCKKRKQEDKHKK